MLDDKNLILEIGFCLIVFFSVMTWAGQRFLISSTKERREEN